MNDDNGIDWRVVGIVLFAAMAACGLPSHCAGALCVARLWDFCCYLRACWVMLE